MSQLNWQLNESNNPALVDELKANLPYSKTFIKLCVSRGLESEDAIREFLNPDETWFNDPYLFYDMEKAASRIYQAIELGEQVLIYGDYDADGVTSTAILYESLQTLAANVQYYIPDRFEDGYGPNKDRYQEFIDQGISLIITVDNGVAGHEAITFAQNKGVDVIITDHHELAESLPDAYAIIHPNHPQGDYPFSDLSGAGVALKLAQVLLEEMPVDFLDLAAIGTVADMVSLTGENRALVHFGLKQLKQTQRIGLRRLMAELDIKLSDIDEQTIGFKLAPVINAVGRLEKADKVVDLLTLLDEEKAGLLVGDFIAVNNERKGIVNKSVDMALSLVDNRDHIHILKHPGWHEGVLGIIASRIVRETGKPAIVLKEFEDQAIVKGSGRSVENFDLFAACNDVRDYFINFGGHKMAAGMTLETDNLEALKHYLNNKIEEMKRTTNLQAQLYVDEVILAEEATLDLIQELNQLKPFGTDNPKPTFMFKNTQVNQVRRIGQDKTHLKLSIMDKDKDQSLDGIGFSIGHLADYMSESTRLDIAGQLEKNEWNNHSKPQLMIEDIKFQSAKIIDKRTSQLKKSLFNQAHTSYICFGQSIADQVKNYIPSSSNLSVANELTSTQELFEKVILVDSPASMAELEVILPLIAGKEITLYLYKTNSLYLNGLPDKESFAKVYRYLVNHQKIPVKQAREALPNYLGISKLTLNMIIKVFLEVNFVKIEQEALNFLGSSQAVDLLATNSYQAFKEAIEAEEQLLFSSKDEVAKLFEV